MIKLFMDDKGERAVGPGEMVSDLFQRFYAANPAQPTEYEEIHIPAGGVFEDHVIAEADGQHFKASFTAGDGGEIEFSGRDEWVPVERVWQEKSMTAVETPEGAINDSKRSSEPAEVEPAGALTKGALDKDDACADDGVVAGGGCVINQSRAVKSLGQHRIGEYLVLWGAPDQKDLHGEYFSPDTASLTGVFDAVGKVPIFYQHAGDPEIKSTVIGTIDIMRPDEIGLWAEGELASAHSYREQIGSLVDAGVLHWSSGTLPRAKKWDADGHITDWLIVDASLTPTPAEFRMVERPVSELRAAYKAVGLDFPTQLEIDKGAEEARQLEVEVERERIKLLSITL